MLIIKYNVDIINFWKFNYQKIMLYSHLIYSKFGKKNFRDIRACEH